MDDQQAADEDDADSSVADDEDRVHVNYGRLNGFLHASTVARSRAAPNSAVGQISVQYNEALEHYLEARQDAIDASTGTPEEAEDAAELADEAREALAAVLAEAANKPLTPEIVDRINDELGADQLTAAELDDIATTANELETQQ